MIRIAGENVYKDNCFETAKGVAYSALFSFFPVLTTLAALLVQVRAEAVESTILHVLYRVAPPGTEEVVRNLFVVRGGRPEYLLIVAVMAATWAASGAITSLMGGFRIAYRIPTGRPFLRERAIAIMLVFTSVVPVCIASALIVFGTWLQGKLFSWLPFIDHTSELNGWVLLAGRTAAYAIAFGAFVLVTAVLYYLGPKRKQSFKAVFPGAVLATVLWLVATVAVGWYLRHVANYNLLYGGVGASLALLVWMYVLAVITLFGCEFNAARERALAIAHAPHPLEPPVPAGRY
ncbi:MAG TPA: YihY/virulence factor BrkB family protein [Bryobacteraceae bacterium]